MKIFLMLEKLSSFKELDEYKNKSDNFKKILEN